MVQACYCVQKCKLHLLVGQGVLEEEVLHTGRREGKGGREGGREGGMTRTRSWILERNTQGG